MKNLWNEDHMKYYEQSETMPRNVRATQETAVTDANHIL